jgi:hypothetical protein
MPIDAADTSSLDALRDVGHKDPQRIGDLRTGSIPPGARITVCLVSPEALKRYLSDGTGYNL